MTSTPAQVRRTYYVLGFGNTLAASLIWGVNTIFLLDAGLNNFQAFAANAFFTAGMVLFEVPTGIVADARGRRTSYLLGTLTLIVTTLIYLWLWSVDGPFWAWAVSSALIGLGFTFFSGAVEACLSTGMSGYRVVWGISRNTRRWWSLAEGEEIGYHPMDDAEQYADKVSPALGDRAATVGLIGGRHTTTALGVRR